ncbi:MAG TPA: hypothetical protein VGQ15_10825 [Gaiellaceae bacterium]|nr:hypothetical protein [Gaiellaceae bacterium]
MTLFPAKLLKGGLVQYDAASGKVLRTISLQYNPDTLTRTLEAQATGGESGDRSQALRLRGAAVEKIRFEAEIDATERLEVPERDSVALGLQPQLAALESLVQPKADDLQANDDLAGRGVLEVLPIEAPLTVFVWSDQRAVPVRVTELSITEEAFDVALNPIRAKVTLGLRVLSVDDLGFHHRGGELFMTYLRNREKLAARGSAGPEDAQKQGAVKPAMQAERQR